MDWKIIFVISAFIIYAIYNAIALSLFGVPKSLSMTYYLFMEKKKWLSVWFPVMMLSMVVLLIPSWLEISDGSYLQFMAFLAAGGIMFTGSAPAFKSSDLENKVHTGSAAFAAIFALLWVIFVSQFWQFIVVWFIFCAFASVWTNTYKTSYIYWLETVAFLSTFSSIIAYHYI
jgi:hypothetical protein